MALHLDVESVRILVADTPRFRTWVGAGDQAAALLRVYRGHEEDFVRPFALVSTGRDARLIRMALGRHLEEGSTYVLFEDAVDVGDDLEEAWTEHTSATGTILEQMGVLSGTGAYVHLTGAELERVSRSDLNEPVQFHQTVAQVKR